jgi:hypothetical protein
MPRIDPRRSRVGILEEIKEAQEYFAKALALEKEAQAAYDEAQIIKVAALNILIRTMFLDQNQLTMAS